VGPGPGFRATAGADAALTERSATWLDPPAHTASSAGRRQDAENPLTLGDVVAAVVQYAANSLEAAVAVDDLMASGRVRLTSYGAALRRASAAPDSHAIRLHVRTRPGELDAAPDLLDDFDADSLDLIETVIELESAFQIRMI
jgi:hypothetical protein